MSVVLSVRLSEREADAFLKADADGRGGWHARPSVALQVADFKIATAIHRARSEAAEGES